MPELPARAGNKAGSSDHEDLANPFSPQFVAGKFGGALPQQLRAFSIVLRIEKSKRIWAAVWQQEEPTQQLSIANGL